MKKIISIFLSVIMLLSASSFGLIANAVKISMDDVKQTVDKIDSGYRDTVSSLVIPTKLKADVTLDKDDYYYGDEIKINLTVTNEGNRKLDTFMVRNKLSHKSFTIKNRTDLRQTVLNSGESFSESMSTYRVPTGIASSVIYQVGNIVEELLTVVYKVLSMIPGSPVVCASDLVYFTYGGIPTYMHTYVFAFVSDEEASDDEYTVSFDANCNDSSVKNPETQFVKSGQCANYPDIAREGYQIIGWYKTKVGSIDIFDFEEPIKNDMVLYARWYNENDTTDTDNDGIIDSIEIQFGSDPTRVDTDDDGVSDYNELNWLNTDPSSVDSNNDGILDGNDDADGDGLTNAEETELGTNPAYYDSDYDYLSDYEEINIYHTDPLNADSDGDGVIDGVEVQNNSNPLEKENVFNTTVSIGEINENNPVAVSATVVTDSSGAGSLEIREATQAENGLLSNQIPGSIGSAYDFSTEGKFISAKISFKYDESIGTVGDDFQPRIYYVNEETGEFEELEEQKIENGTVTATVKHFSTYILLNKTEYDKIWDKDIKKPTDDGTGFKDLLISFIIDSSGSMSWNDPSGLRKELTKNFIDKMANEDQASIIDFDSYAKTNSDFTSDKDSLKVAVNWIDSSGGTCMYRGLSQSLDLFKNIKDISDESLKIMFLLTDGDDDGSYSESKYMSFIDDCVANGIQVYTIGLGNEANAQLLNKIAAKGNGKYYFAEKDLDLISGFDSLRQETIDYVTDSNNDGICDYYTNLIDSGKLLPSNGSYDYVGVIDKYGTTNGDWDGDGLLNGEEIEIATSSKGYTYIKIKSNPLVSDSDGDNIGDYVEVKKYNTNPMKYTKYGSSSIGTLTSDIAYIYAEQVKQKQILNSIVGLFDWQKTNESKETFINYFYDYASDDSISSAATLREQLAKREQAWKVIETIVDFVKIGKDCLDLGTDLASYDDVVKGQVTRYNNLHKEALSLYNKKDYDGVLKSVKGVDTLKKDLSVVNDLLSDVLSKPDIADKISGTISVVSTTTSMISALGNVRLDLGDKINTFSRKYQTWLGKRPTGDVSVGTVLSVATDAVGLVTDVADLTNLYGKLQANSEAFNEYIELIEYVSNNADNDYTRVAAGDIAKIVLDKSDSEYYRQLNSAIGETSAKAFINIAITIVGDFCPYVKVAKMVVDVVKISLSLTGITEYAKSLVKSQAIYAITSGCNYFLSGLYENNGIWYSFDVNDGDKLNLYLTQLAQSRIVGEDSICDYMLKWSISHMISFWIEHMSKEDYENLINNIIDSVYNCAERLNLNVSKELPHYPNDFDSNWDYSKLGL